MFSQPLHQDFPISPPQNNMDWQRLACHDFLCRIKGKAPCTSKGLLRNDINFPSRLTSKLPLGKKLVMGSDVNKK